MNHVLAAVDLSGISDAVIREAEFFAQALSARLTLLHVAAPNPEDFVGYEAGPQAVRDSRAHKLRQEHANLQSRAADISTRGLDTSALLVEGPTVETILKQADRFDSKLIVIGSHGHGMLYHALVGSTSAGVVKESHRPILIVPDSRLARRR